MIAVKELTKHYGEAVAVSGISFEVQPSEVTGFLGPNGAGKSTTLRMLAGYLAPTSGTARLGGKDIIEDNLEVRRLIGYLPENNPLYEEMDVAEYLEFTANIRGFQGALADKRIRNSVEACNLGEALVKPIGLLSKGFRQRVGLAAAILHDPKILLLDEPTSGLDPNQAREVRELIARLKKEKTVLLSTHILPEVEASCDRVVILHEGKIAAYGTPSEIVGRASGRVRVAVAIKAQGLEASAAVSALEGLPGVTGAKAESVNGELRLQVEGGKDAGDLREEIFHMAVDKKWTLLELSRKTASLESVFSELTPGAAAVAGGEEKDS